MTDPDSPPFRVVALLTDAFGGVGGIQLYNRDLLTALCEHPCCEEVVAVPRKMKYSRGAIPEKLTYRTDGLDGTLNYCRALLRAMATGRFDLLVCCHLNLFPLAWLVALFCRVPLLLVLFGKEAWHPRGTIFTRLLLRRVTFLTAISRLTDRRFRSWARVRCRETVLLPNAICLEQYGPGPKEPALLRRFGLEGKRVLMTFGRLESRDRQKGFDEVLQLMPRLLRDYPNLVYLIAGAGPDRVRLERETAKLGLTHQVVFTGMVPEGEKAEYYRLADVYVMPSRKEGFGFVFLEAMACGIPVIASLADGSREAVRDGLLGALVDPGNPDELFKAIGTALKQPRGVIPPGLEFFSREEFIGRVHELADRVMGRGVKG
jgi:phosphatidyl-myo-inositol dimannoside synthase